MKNLSIKNFFFREIYNTEQNKKWKYYDFVRVINCTYKLACVPARACAIARVSGNSVIESLYKMKILSSTTGSVVIVVKDRRQISSLILSEF